MNNLLKTALSIIPPVTFQVKKYASNTVNSLGVMTPTYSTAVTVSGSLQAVDNAAYQQLGLEFGKNYVSAWANMELLGIDRQLHADQIVYGGKTFNVIKSTNWNSYNGWSSAICVEVKP